MRCAWPQLVLAPIPSVRILTRGGNTLANLSAVKQLKKERELVQHQLFGLNAAPEAFERLSRKDAQEAPRPSQQFALKVQDSAPTTAGDGRPTA